MTDHQISEVVNQELRAFVSNTTIDPCWRKLVSDLQALPLLGAPICVLVRPSGEFVSFVFESWNGGIPDVRLEDDEAVRTEALFYGITDNPSLRILCRSIPSNAVVCWQCRGTGNRTEIVTDSCTCRGLGWLPPNRHLDPASLIIACSSPAMIRDAINDARLKLSPEFRKRLAKVERHFISFKLSGFDVEGLYLRMNNRSVAQILAEDDLEPEPTPIASGQIDGVRYKLYDSPDLRNARLNDLS